MYFTNAVMFQIYDFGTYANLKQNLHKCHGRMDGVMIDAAVLSSVINTYLNRYQKLA